MSEEIEKMEAARAVRQQQLDKLRNELKVQKITQRSIANATRKSVGWIGEVLRGNCPEKGACIVPVGIAKYLIRRGFDVPRELWDFYPENIWAKSFTTNAETLYK